MAITIANLMVRIGADIAPAIRGLQQADQRVGVFGATANRVLGSIPAAANTSGRALDAVGGAAGRAAAGTAKLSTATQSMQGALRTGESLSTAFSGSLLGALKTGAALGGGMALLSGGIALVGAAFRAVRGAAIDFNASLEQSKAGWTTMLGSGTAASAMLFELQRFAATTPFEFPELEANAKRLIGMGFAARDVIPLLTDIGNVTAGMGSGAEGVDRITRSLGQMQAKTKVQTEELLQLNEMGVPALQILADAMGTTTAKAQEMVTAGQVASDTFIIAFRAWSQAKFGDAMVAQSRTFNGAMSTIRDSLRIAGAQAFKPLFDGISGLAQQFATFVQTEQFTRWAIKMAAASSIAVDAIGAIGRQVAAVLGIRLPASTDKANGSIQKHVKAHVALARATQTTTAATTKLTSAADTTATAVVRQERAIKLAERGLRPYEAAIDRTQDALENQRTRTDAAKNAVDRITAALSTAQSRFDGFANANLRGTRAFADAIFAIEQQQAAVQLRLLDFKGPGGTLDRMLAPIASSIRAQEGAVAGWAGRVRDAQAAVEGQESAVESAASAIGIYDQAVQAAQRAMRMQADAIDQQTTALGIYEQAVEGSKRAVADESQRLDEARDRWEAVTDAIQAQIDKRNEWSGAPLEGTAAFREQLQAIDDQAAQVQLRLTEMKLGGASDDAMKPLEEQLERLRLQEQRLRLQQQLSVGRQRRELEDLANTAEEVNYGDAAAGIASATREIERLNGMLGPHEQAVRDQEVALAAAQAQLAANEEAHRLQVVAIDNEKLALGELEKQLETTEAARDSYQQVIDAEKLKLDALNASLGAIQRQYDTHNDALATLREQYDTTREQALAPFEAQLDALGVAAERTQLLEKLQLDPLRRQIDDLARPLSELTFDEIVSGMRDTAGEVATLEGKLGPATLAWERETTATGLAEAALKTAQTALEKQKKPIDEMKDSLVDLNFQLDELKTNADEAAPAATGLIDPLEGLDLKDPTLSLAAFAQGIKDAKKDMELALKPITDLNTEMGKWALAMDTAWLATIKSGDNFRLWFVPHWAEVTRAAREAGSDIQGTWTRLGEDFTLLWNHLDRVGLDIETSVRTNFAAAGTAINKAFNDARDTLFGPDGAIESIKTKFGAWTTGAFGADGWLLPGVLSVGTGIVTTIQDGIEAGWGTFTTWLKGQFDGLLSLVPDWLKNLWGTGGSAGAPSTAAPGTRGRGSTGQPGDPILTDRAVDMVLPGGRQSDSYNARRDMDADGQVDDLHGGLDIAGGIGASVRAVRGGRVVFAAPNQWGGTAVIIENAAGEQWYYGHLRGDIDVGVGEDVTAGQVIGQIGDLRHVHLQYKKNGQLQDPSAILEALAAAGTGSGPGSADYRAQTDGVRAFTSSLMEQVAAQQAANRERQEITRRANDPNDPLGGIDWTRRLERANGFLHEYADRVREARGEMDRTTGDPQDSLLGDGAARLTGRLGVGTGATAGIDADGGLSRAAGAAGADAGIRYGIGFIEEQRRLQPAMAEGWRTSLDDVTRVTFRPWWNGIEDISEGSGRFAGGRFRDGFAAGWGGGPDLPMPGSGGGSGIGGGAGDRPQREGRDAGGNTYQAQINIYGGSGDDVIQALRAQGWA